MKISNSKKVVTSRELIDEIINLMKKYKWEDQELLEETYIKNGLRGILRKVKQEFGYYKEWSDQRLHRKNNPYS